MTKQRKIELNDRAHQFRANFLSLDTIKNLDQIILCGGGCLCVEEVRLCLWPPPTRCQYRYHTPPPAFGTAMSLLGVNPPQLKATDFYLCSRMSLETCRPHTHRLFPCPELLLGAGSLPWAVERSGEEEGGCSEQHTMCLNQFIDSLSLSSRAPFSSLSQVTIF